MYIDIIQYHASQNLEALISLQRHVGFHATIIAVDEWNLVDYILELNTQSTYPLIPMLTVDRLNVKSEYVGKAIVAASVGDEKEFRKALRSPYLSVITLNLGSLSNIINLRTIHLARQYRKFIEIPLAPLLRASPSHRVHLFRSLYRKAPLLSKSFLGVVFSSRAMDIFDVISPRQIRAILIEAGFRDRAIKSFLKINTLKLILSPLETLIVKDERLLEAIYKIRNIAVTDYSG